MLVSLFLMALLVAACVYILRRKTLDKRSRPQMDGTLEYRSPLAFDECLDALRHPTPEDEFAYRCERDKDGSFTLQIIRHQPTNQPLDTLYSLRLDPGKQTVVTIIFIRDAFGYGEPVFPRALMDRFMLQKLQAIPADGDAVSGA